MDNPDRQYRELRLKDGRTVRARVVERSDADHFMEFFERISPENRQFMHGYRFDRETAERITRTLDDRTWYRVVVVNQTESGERIVGYSWIQPMAAQDAKPFLGIGLVDEFTSAGLGRMLLRLMIGDAREVLRLDCFWLGVFADNPRAIRAYEAAGFRDDPDMPPKDFDGRTEVYMVANTG